MRFLLLLGLLWLPSLLMASPKPYNKNYYTVSYQTFMASGHVGEAMQVANDALYWQPNNILWLRRLSQAALWSGESEQALNASLKTARVTQRLSDWQQVVKLAASHYNYKLELEARSAILKKSPKNEPLIEDIKQNYIFLGQETEGLAFFQGFYQQHPSAASLKAMSEMAKLSGDELLSGHYYEQYFERYGYEDEIVIAVIESYWLLGQQKQAYQLSEKALQTSQYPMLVRHRAAMAYSFGEWQEALTHYDLLVELGADNKVDRSYYLSLLHLLHLNEPGVHAEKNVALWEKSGESVYASQLFHALLEQEKYQEMALFLQNQSPEQRQVLNQDDEFARVLSLYYQRTGQYSKAQEALSQASRLSPTSQANKIAWIWYLIEIADREKLQLLLNHWQVDLSRNEVGLRVLSAGFIALGQGDNAVKSEQKAYAYRVQAWQSQWFYWLTLQYAGKTDNANAMLLKLRKSLPAQAPRDAQKVLYYAVKHQLLLQFGSGSEVMVFNQQLLSSRDLTHKQKAALATQWAQSQGSPALAGKWYKYYTRNDVYQHQRVTLAQALYQEDEEAIRTVFSAQKQHISLTEQLMIELTAGDTSLAKNTYLDLQRGMPSWSTTQLFQEPLLLGQSDAWQFNTRQESLGGLKIKQYHLSQQKAVGDFSVWSLEANFYRYQDDQQSFISLDETEQQLVLGFSTDEGRSYLAGEFWLRQLLDEDRFGALFEWRQLYQYGFNSSLLAHINEPADETTLLNVIGERSGVTALLGWQTAKYWQNSINASLYEYHDITDNHQGKSRLWDAITEYRPWLSRFSPGFRVQASYADFYDKQGLALEFSSISRLPANARVLPNDYYQVQASLLLGQQDMHIRAHRLNAWAELGILENSEFGQGYSAKAGVEGDLLGRDEWQLLLEKSFNQSGIQFASYAIEINYQMYY